MKVNIRIYGDKYGDKHLSSELCSEEKVLTFDLNGIFSFLYLAYFSMVWHI
jgi:hypothetical protein